MSDSAENPRGASPPEGREGEGTRIRRLPDALVACVGGGSNAMGLFHPFLDDADVAIYGVEAAGDGLDTGRHAAPLTAGSPGVLHGNRTYLMEDDDGQIIPTHSVSAGLDYPGVGPEHAWLKDTGRASYVAIDDKEALAAFHDLTLAEGIAWAVGWSLVAMIGAWLLNPVCFYIFLAARHRRFHRPMGCRL